MDEAPGVEQQQQPQPLEPTQQPHPILRKKRLNQDSNSASNHHVRIAPSPTSHDENENEDDGIVEEPWKDRENPFRPGSDLDRQADSLLRNSRISGTLFTWRSWKPIPSKNQSTKLNRKRKQHQQRRQQILRRLHWRRHSAKTRSDC
ncbi:hypothetical protein BOX15_Mlig021436g2 [Macrostomum lignano]|uniref:Uncharacterized protein n=1 Tax=Macrostomum lignano TaxID=282301 RepID=A0A267FLH3_9PLAT|nr:hypothetical protein BOX15_Mlig021436g2 [Macrostomum lignano]